MVSGFSKQTVEKQGSLVFCESKAPKPAHTVGERGALTALPGEGATQAPVICSEAERERMEPLERMSVFAGNARHRCSSSVKKRGLKVVTQNSSPSAVVEQLLRRTGNSTLVLFKPLFAEIPS